MRRSRRVGILKPDRKGSENPELACFLQSPRQLVTTEQTDHGVTSDVTPGSAQETKTGVFTPTRILLASILVFQLFILAGLYMLLTRERRPAPAPERTERDDVVLRALKPVSRAYHATPVSTTPPRLSSPFSGGDPMAEEFQRMHEIHAQMIRNMSADLGRMERLFDDGWGSVMTSPTMDMRDLGDRYAVDVSLPGIASANIEVVLQGRLLRIRASSRDQTASHDGFSEFEQQVLLPGTVQAYSNAVATLTNGILRVTIPKAQTADPASATGHVPLNIPSSFPSDRNMTTY